MWFYFYPERLAELFSERIFYLSFLLIFSEESSADSLSGRHTAFLYGERGIIRRCGTYFGDSRSARTRRRQCSYFISDYLYVGRPTERARNKSHLFHSVRADCNLSSFPKKADLLEIMAYLRADRRYRSVSRFIYRFVDRQLCAIKSFRGPFIHLRMLGDIPQTKAYE